MGQDVVILGADGTEHVFPPGFDPQKAAAIVRGDTTAAPSTAAPDDDAPVTLGDLINNPSAATAQIGHLLKNDLMDPKTWVALAAAYLGPKVPGLATAARGPLSRTATAVGNALDNPVIGAISPRARNMGETLRVGGKLMEPATAAPATTTPFHELPLHVQEAQLAAAAARPNPGRSSSPPARPDAAVVPPTPFNQLPLHVQEAELAAAAARPNPARSSSPPRRPDTAGEIAASAPPKPATTAAPTKATAPAKPPRVKTGAFDPGEALKAAKTIFEALTETPRPAELTNAVDFIRRGASAADAVAKVLAKRPPSAPTGNAASAFAKAYGLPNAADVAATVGAKNARGTK